MMSAADASLKRLGTDYVDVLCLRREDATTPLEETLAAVAQLIERGKSKAGVAPPEGSRAARNGTRIMQTEFRPDSLALAEKMAEHARARGLTPFSAEDEAFVSGLVTAGHASTPGYKDPQYPLTGRVLRTG
jgi:aryl-alcohol dehydrogenase-like predicted oxidoreductase